jgi:multidrug efflux pump subunit AcrA (membrane-fusion protein)
VLQGERVEVRFIQLGRQSGELVEVLRGVRPGERVATSELGRLADGAPVEDRGGR